jgi:plasmid maintenance system antidote protein VapI
MRGLSRTGTKNDGYGTASDMRLSAAFGTSPEVWVRLQANYDLAKAMRGRRVKIERLAA